MADIGLFDVIGPRMVGPSSSHTAGACLIALTAHRLFKATVRRAEFVLYGSFAETWAGHGTDRALLGGVLGFEPGDLRIRDSRRYAREAGLTWRFREDRTAEVAHPNTVDITLWGDGGAQMALRGVSTGGGKMKICRLDDVEVNFTGEYPTLIILHEDMPGVISYFTGILGDRGINIAEMRCFRRERGSHRAISVVESDQRIEEELVRDLELYRPIHRVVPLQF